MKAKLSILASLVLIQFVVKAQMKIGDSPTNINSASLLELESANKGLVFPRVPLSNVNSPAPLPTGLLTGTMVYNTNTSIIGGNGAGLYIWNGLVWMSINMGSTSTTAWSLTGNTGTGYTINFLGTTDNVGLRLRTNNIQRMLVDSIGSVAIGSEAFDTANREKLLVDYGTTTSRTIARFKGNINSYLQVDVQNTSTGNNATSKYTARADDGTDSTFIIHMGINNSPYNTSSQSWGIAHDAYLYSSSKNLLVGAKGLGSDVIFLIGGGDAKLNSVFRIVGPSGNIVVGRGDISDLPVGNILRGPNGSGTNIAGGNLTFRGGSGTGTASGGDLNLSGGNTDTGPIGVVNINIGKNGGATYINTGTSSSNISLGGSANNILLPKFATVGGMYYTSLATGQISTTGVNMTWDSINKRLGIGTTNPLNALSVIASNPLYLSGLQAITALASTDSILTITGGVVKRAPSSLFSGGGGSGWLTTGNSGTNAASFIGTTDQQGLTFKVNNIQAGFLGLEASSYATSLGVRASAVYQSTAIGFGAQATGSNASLAVGYQAIAGNQNSIAIGTSDTASADEGVSIGYKARVNAFRGIAIGPSAKVSGSTQNIAIGYNSNASSFNGIAIGSGAIAATNNNTMALGFGASATGYISLAVGNAASATGQNATAFGAGAVSSGEGSNVFGNSATASGKNSLGIGNSTSASGENSISIGDNSDALDLNAIAIGTTARATKQNATVVGYQSTASGAGSSVYGNNSTASGNNSIIIGDNSSATGTNTMVIGNGLTTASNDVLILGNSAKKIGMGTSTPTEKLDVVGNIKFSGLLMPNNSAGNEGQVLTSNGTGAAPTWQNNAVSNRWSITGNSGTKPNTNFLGTTDTAALVVQTGNPSTERIRILGRANGSSQAGWIGMGIAAPRSPVDMTGNFTNKNILTIQNTSNSGYSSVDLFDDAGVLAGTFGYANTGVTNGAIGGKNYFFIYNHDFIIGTNSNNTNFFMQASTGNVGIGGTAAPTAKLDVNGTIKLGTNGTTLNAVIDASGATATVPSQINTNAMGTATVSVANAAQNSPVIISPRTFPGNAFVIAYARVINAGQVTIGIYNTSGNTINANATFTVDVVVINP